VKIRGPHRIAASATTLAVAVAMLVLPVPPATGSAITRTQTFAYAPDFASVIANPGRGYFENFTGFDYLHPQDFDADYAEWLTDPEYDSWRFDGGYLEHLSALRADRVTVLDANIYLNDYVDSPELPQPFVDELSRALRVVREAGLKIILRIVYADASTPMLTEENYMRHIEQVGDVITENADIVESLDAGILGPWGEWHNDDDYVMVDDVSYLREERPEYASGTPTTDIDSPQQGARRYRLIKQLLDHTPDTIPISIRYVEFLMEIEALAGNPPAGTSALTLAQRDRLGLHDDSFVSFALSHTRAGGWADTFSPYWDPGRTYDQVGDVAAHANHLETSYGGDVMQHGETSWYPDDGYEFGSDDDPLTMTRVIDAGARLALSESEARKVTLVNRSWHVRHLDFWKDTRLRASGNDPAESAYTRLDRKLGYRLRLDTVELTTAAQRGDTVSIKAHIYNDGYAGIIRPRPVFAVFDNGANRYDIELTDVDARTWRSGHNILDASVTLPAGMVAGEYAVALWLPDGYEDLRGIPQYSVRFANKGIWCGSKGYNYLGTVEYHGDGQAAINRLSAGFIAELGDDPDNPRGDRGYQPTFNPALIAGVSVSTSAWAAPQTGGATSVTVTTTQSSWNGVSNASWLTLSPKSGKSGRAVTLSAALNTTTSPRVAIVTFTANGAVTQVRVTQPGVVDDHGSTIATASAWDIVSAHRVTGSLEIGDDIDYFSFTAPVSGIYTFTSDGTGNVSGYLFDAAGSQVASNLDSGPGSNFKITHALTASSRYYLAIRNSSQKASNTKTGPYGIDVVIPPAATVSVTQASWSPPQTGAELSVTVTTNQSTWAGTSSASWLKLGTKSGKSGRVVKLTAEFNATTSARDAVVTVTANGAVARVTVHQPGAVDDHGSTIATASAWNIATTPTQAGSLELGDDVDYFSFTAPATASYRFVSAATGNVDGYLFNASGTVIASNLDSGPGSNFQITYKLTSGQVYYLGIRNHTQKVTNTKTGPYTITAARL
jgi:hypothetical protein